MIDFINYNWMPTIADHCLDLPEEFYISAGVSRLHSRSELKPEDVMEDDIVFVKTDYLHDWTFQKDFLPKIKNRFTLVTGISSYNIQGKESDIIENENVKHWFCTNPPSTKNKKITPLPIGFEEKEREGGNQEILRNRWDKKREWKYKSDLMYLPYHTVGTNASRDSQIKYLESLDFVEVEKEKLPFDQYLEKMGRYKYIICLAGAGYDTHRNYEALLVGSMPIMVKSCVKQIYDFYELPAVFIEDWSEINWAKLQTDFVFYDKPFPVDQVYKFLNVDLHKQRIISHAKD